MHSALNRLQTSFGFFTTCAFSLFGIIALLSLIPLPTLTRPPTATITPRALTVSIGRAHYSSPKREEQASIRFDLSADLSPLFTWNTKQVFVYVSAIYNDVLDPSESVIWDTIIPCTATPWSLSSLQRRYFPDARQKREQQAQARRKTNPKAATKQLVVPGVLTLKNQKPKYLITDPSGTMTGRNVSLQLSWNVQPWVGALVWDTGYLGSRTGRWDANRSGRSDVFELPSVAGKKTEAVRSSVRPEAGEASPVVDL